MLWLISLEANVYCHLEKARVALVGRWILSSWGFFWHSLLLSYSPMSLGQTGEAAGTGPAGVVASKGNSGVENTSYFVALA